MNAAAPTRMPLEHTSRDFLDAVDDRVMVFDGAMGTMLQDADLPLSDYDGLENCSEVLVLTRPDVVRGIHGTYFGAGADIVETNTFGGSSLVLAEYGLETRTREINRIAVELAREAAQGFSTESRPRFVAGSIGPGTKLPSLGHVHWDVLLAAYQEQVRGLVDGGPDVLLVETCQDILQTKCALAAIADVFAELGVRIPVMAQVTMETTGTMLVGTEIGAANVVLDGFEHVERNCAAQQDNIVELSEVGRLAELLGSPRSELSDAQLAQHI